jgi:hypothetical protein
MLVNINMWSAIVYECSAFRRDKEVVYLLGGNDFAI